MYCGVVCSRKHRLPYNCGEEREREETEMIKIERKGRERGDSDEGGKGSRWEGHSFVAAEIH